jgi:histidinol-phosphatase
MYDKELEVALAAVDSAEKVVLHYLDAGVRAELKDDQTPVTAADREAEETIQRVIRKTFPEHNFYGEEGEKADLRNHRGWTWIIDPIDGTRAYVRGNPLFSTLLALMHDGEVVVGVSNMPLMHEQMWATATGGAFLNGKRVQVSRVGRLSDGYLSFGSPNRFGDIGRAEQFMELCSKMESKRGYGDAWSYHLVAQGKIDVMAEPAVHLWDIAPFKLIVEEAGGRLTDLDGRDVRLATTTALATNGLLHDDVVRVMRAP